MPLTSVINIYKIKLARLFLEHGADINYRDSKGLTSLKASREKGKGKVVGLLKSHGAKD
jgi:hypothetical protein